MINLYSFSNEFYIPYLGILLRDISFYEANYEYLIKGNLINIEKIEKIQNIIDNFLHLKIFQIILIKIRNIHKN